MITKIKFAACTLVLLVMSASGLQAMTLREKVGQLFVIRPEQLNMSLAPDQVHSNTKHGAKTLTQDMIRTLEKYPAGGFAIFSKNLESPGQLRKLTHDLREASKYYPIMAIDEEGGKISRIANNKNFHVKKFPSSESIAQSGKTREAASTIARYIHDLGFNMNFAPVADVNTNPDNIVIGTRAFGDDPDFVALNVGEYLDGLHEHGITGCMKHFPGHGDTRGDTHNEAVSVFKTWDELLHGEIIPFKANLDKTDAIMTAHIIMKNVTGDNLPASISRELITGKLRGELGYDGVIITDALKMDAISKHYNSGEAAIMALEAGCDILLMPYDYIKAFEAVLNAIKSGRIPEQRLDESVKRIMKLKQYSPDSQ